MIIASVVGARPNIIKMAPIHKKLINYVNHVIIHTGQHYDYQMSEAFFKEFNLPEPNFNLEVGSGTANYQIGQTMLRLEKVLDRIEPNFILVYGDTNSTLAGALCARKCNIPIGHIEAGLRSFDKRMSEETNRIIADHISEYLFAPTKTAIDNLRKENVQGKSFQSGDISVEIVKDALKLKSNILSDLDLKPFSYILLTIHRAENTDSPAVLKSIIDALRTTDDMIILFPIHPRTRKILQDMGLYRSLEESKHIRLIPPAGYVDFINLVKSADKVVTDSGGVQKEAYLLGAPCITIRENTEWVETVEENKNIVVGTENQAIVRAIREWVPSDNETKTIFGQGSTSDDVTNIVISAI